jgi:hypothetical protein
MPLTDEQIVYLEKAFLPVVLPVNQAAICRVFGVDGCG